MENYIRTLYKRFLYGNIKRDEFLEMRHEINSVTNDELKDILAEEWAMNISTGNIAEQDKKNIKSKLAFFIEFDKKRMLRKRMLQIAAIAIPFVMVASFYILSNQTVSESKEFVVSVKHGNRAQVTLPDQTKVWMNSNSKLVYTTGKKNTREVKLVGEAFFKVFNDKSRPFIVSAKNLQVEVLGTSFNVKAQQESDLIETSLVEGSIKLSGTELAQDYYLKPNEKAIYSSALKILHIKATDNEVETAWKDNKLQFKSERFADVITRLEEWYGVKIISKCPKIENDLMSGAFKGESLETVLETFRIQYNIRYNHQGDTLVILYN